jgi:hypothetical protein
VKIEFFVPACKDIIEPSDEPWNFREIGFALVKKISWRCVAIVVFFGSFSHVSDSGETITAKDDHIIFLEEFGIVSKKEFEAEMFESVIDDEGEFSWKPRKSMTEKSRHDGNNFSFEPSSPKIETSGVEKPRGNVSTQCFCHHEDESFTTTTVDESVVEDTDSV